ncbi:hypothetical protein GF357_01925 [Candidatus Dojkabacteria bacterium]|nr:hypothetical protein [Candidatus Dojkabacteria bacterium]
MENQAPKNDPSQIQSSRKKQNRLLVALVALVVLFAITSTGLAIYIILDKTTPPAEDSTLTTQQDSQRDIYENTSTTESETGNNTESMNESANDETDSLTDSSKRNFDPETDFFLEEPYPEELLNFKDAELQQIECTDKYKNNGVDEITDPEYLSEIDNISYTVRETFLCEITNGRLYYFRNQEMDPSKIKNTLVYIDNEGERYVTDFQEESMQQLPFWIINSFLAATTQDSVYIAAAAGDGPTGFAEIYRWDTTSGNIELVTNCSSTCNMTPTEVVCTGTCE